MANTTANGRLQTVLGRIALVAVPAVPPATRSDLTEIDAALERAFAPETPREWARHRFTGPFVGEGVDPLDEPPDCDVCGVNKVLAYDEGRWARFCSPECEAVAVAELDEDRRLNEQREGEV